MVAIVLASVLAVAIHKIATRPEQIDRDTFEEALLDGLYATVYLKDSKVTCVDLDGKRYTFTVEDACEFDEYARDTIGNFELETEYYSNVDSASNEEN